jgi:hypothetical protein
MTQAGLFLLCNYYFIRLVGSEYTSVQMCLPDGAAHAMEDRGMYKKQWWSFK